MCPPTLPYPTLRVVLRDERVNLAFNCLDIGTYALYVDIAWLASCRQPTQLPLTYLILLPLLLNIFFCPLLISTVAVSSKITSAYYTPSHYRSLYLYLFLSVCLSSPFPQTLFLNCSQSFALFFILIFSFIYCPTSSSLLLLSLSNTCHKQTWCIIL